MNREKIAKELIKKFGEKEIIRLIKRLEKKGEPIQIYVQVRADTPYSSRYSHKHSGGVAEAYFGRFNDRFLEVKRLEDLDPKYEHDVKLLEGSYKDLGELEKTIKKYGAFQVDALWGGIAEKAYQIVKREMSKKYKNLMLVTPLAANFRSEDKEFMEQIRNILESKGIVYLHHRITAKSDGLYDDRTSGRTLIINETKIADISLKLL